MATSGSVDFSLSRNDIITEAFRKIGVVAEDGTPSSAQYTKGAIVLNSLIKSWNASLGMPLWALKIGYILPVSGTNEISISTGTSGGHTTNSYVTTTTTVDAAATDTTITVTSVSGIADTYYIGIELDSGDIQWTTVSGAPAGLVVTLAVGLTSAASSGARVYCYQTKLLRPLRITYAYTHNLDSDVDVSMDIVTSHEYLQYSNKNIESQPLFLSYAPEHTTGVVKIWPRFVDASRIITIQYHRPIEDFDASGDTPDFPQEWYLPLILKLAELLCPDYGVAIERFQMIRTAAKEFIKEVGDNDYEEGSIYFVPKSKRYS